MSSLVQADFSDLDQVWNYDKPAETEVRFRELLPQIEKSGNLDLLLQLWTQIARTQGLQRKFSDAHKTLDNVARQLSKNTIVAEIRYELERGRVFNSSQEKEKARPYFQKAFDLSVENRQDNFAVDAAHMMAIVETVIEKQMEWNLRALALSEKSNDRKAQRWLGSLYNNLGWTYHDSGQLSKALEMFQKALNYWTKEKDPVRKRIASWCVARTYRSLGRIDESLEIQKALAVEIENLADKDGYIYEELGELYLLKNMISESQKYFRSAYRLLSKDEWFITNEAQRLDRIRRLAGESL